MKTFAAALLLSQSLFVVSAADNIQVFSSPKGGCTEVVVKNLGKATNSVLIQVYSFTSAPIARALVDIEKRGVNVQVILDKLQRTEKYSGAVFIQRAGIPTFIDAKHMMRNYQFAMHRPDRSAFDFHGAWARRCAAAKPVIITAGGDFQILTQRQDGVIGFHRVNPFKAFGAG